ncbi:GNAT family N-acetyltransferase [Tahibacter amnicola]|uniref:GNAT family N-acetyltransferase n=1 Tax=Tahibacter amnicola TaxID=2976241 RepID=A0ABY6BKF7_9GAMM|nr:GNAT family N-acetyltransferase [Tahibacter amnicola]UXI68277.1 GNAT family N-acetyltransferase [Tahibacter amnicola]
MRIYTTARLVLRPLQEGDRALFEYLYGDAGVMEHVARPLSSAGVERAFAAALPSLPGADCRHAFFSVAEAAGQNAFGLAGLQSIDRTRGCAEAGILLPAERQSCGYGKEILRKLTEIAFDSFGLDEVYVQYRRAHERAEQLVVSVGFSALPETADPAPPPWRTWRMRRAPG